MFTQNLYKIGIAIIVLLKVALIFVYRRCFEPDSYMHLLQLRAVYADIPHNLSTGMSVWAKPLYTYLLAPFTYLPGDDLLNIQIINIAINCLTLWVMYKSALAMQISQTTAKLFAVLAMFSVILFRSSISSLTEPIFGLVIVSAVYFTLIGRYSLAAFLFGVSVLARIEGLWFVGMFIVWYSISQKWQKTSLGKLLILLITPTVIWNAIGALQTGDLLYLHNGGYPVTGKIYGIGSWIFYLIKFTKWEGLFFGLAAVSLIYFMYKLIYKRRLEKNLFLLHLLLWSFIATQIITWRFGLFGSAGLMRYFVVVMPLMILLAADIFDKIIQKFTPAKQKVLMVSAFCFCSVLLISKFKEQLIPYNVTDYHDAGTFLAQVDKDTHIYARPEMLYFANRNSANSDIGFTSAYEKRLPGYYAYDYYWQGQELGLSIIAREEIIYSSPDSRVLIFAIP